MKLYLYIIFLSISGFAYADWFNGYYINLQDDTIKCAVEIPVNKFHNRLAISTIQRKIKVASEDKFKTFKSSEIKGFYINDFGGVHFKSIKVDDKKILFLQVVSIGKINLYKFDYITELPNTAPFIISKSVFGDQIPYFVQMDEKEVLFCRSLKKFLEYVNDSFFESRYESAEGHWGLSIESFVAEYNDLKEDERKE